MSPIQVSKSRVKIGKLEIDDDGNAFYDGLEISTGSGSSYSDSDAVAAVNATSSITTTCDSPNIVQTSVSGNAGTVTTNANLTGHVTSVGNAASLGSFTVAQLSTALSDASISGNNTGDQTVAYSSAIAEGNSGLVPAEGTSGHFLAYNGAFSQVGYSDLSGTPTLVTDLDGLSDVSFSSGDLEITSLDRIKFPNVTSTTFELKGKLLFRDFGSGDAGYDFLAIDEDGHNIIMDNDTTQLELKCWSSVGSVSSNTALKLYSNSGDIHLNGNQNNIKFDSGGVASPQTEIEFDLFYIDGLAIFTKQVIYNPNDRDDYFEIKIAAEGATTLTTHDQDTTAAHLSLIADGNIVLDAAGDIEINADGGDVEFKDNATDLAKISSSGILAKTLVYFDAETTNAIGDGATGVIDWTVNQKQKLTITGTSITCNFTNPPGPCNLMLKVIQGDGSDEIGSWDGDIKWPSGNAPTLSTGNGEIDILSFYFDGTNYFGVGSLNFS